MVISNMNPCLDCTHSRTKSPKSGPGGTAIRVSKSTLPGVPFWATKTAPGGGEKRGKKCKTRVLASWPPDLPPGREVPSGRLWGSFVSLFSPHAFSSSPIYIYIYILAKTRQYPLTEDRIGIRSKRANKIERNDQHIRSRASIMKSDQHF